MCNQSRPHQLSDHDCQVGSDCHHTVLEVVVELRSVSGHLQNLVTQLGYVEDVQVRDLVSMKTLLHHRMPEKSQWTTRNQWSSNSSLHCGRTASTLASGPVSPHL